jgi:hypothetical protein
MRTAASTCANVGCALRTLLDAKNTPYRNHFRTATKILGGGYSDKFKAQSLSPHLPEPIAKPAFPCHPERSEGSHIFNGLRSFTSFRMTEKPVLKWLSGCRQFGISVDPKFSEQPLMSLRLTHKL